MTDRIAPGVVIDGETVTPPGWAWVLAFAIRGIFWAVKEASKPEFQRLVDTWRDWGPPTLSDGDGI